MTSFPSLEAPAVLSEESRLLERCRAGEDCALRELYQRHKVQVYRLVARMIATEADRDEVVQDIFLHVFRSLSSFRGGAKLSTWVHRVALNIVLQHLRSKRSRIRLDLVGDKALPHLSADDHRDPELDAMAAQRQAAVARSLARLSPKKRAVLVLHDFEGVSGKEIAQIVGAPLFTVRTRLFYARKEFYELLAQEPSFDGIDLGEQERP